MRLPPPEPVAIKFMVRAKDQRNGSAVFSFQTIGPTGNTLENVPVLLVCSPSRYQVLHSRLRYGIHPVEATFRYRVIKMPGSCNHAAPIIGILYDLLQLSLVLFN